MLFHKHRMQKKLIAATAALAGGGMLILAIFIMSQASTLYRKQIATRVRQQARAQAALFQDKINPVAVILKPL